MNFQDAISAVKESAGSRNFVQAVDLVINIENLDLNDPENRFSDDIKLPHQASDDVSVCVIGETITRNADNADKVVNPDELEEYMDDKKKAKQLAESYDFLLAEAPLMPKIGKELGSVLGPRNKMPQPVQPGEDPSELIDDLRSTISVQLKESPSIKCKIGKEDMSADQLIMNAETVYNTVTDHLPQRDHNVKNVLVKLTMSNPVEVA